MPRAFSLGNPAPGHRPEVGRVPLGSTFLGGRTYGTTLRCSCSWVPNADRSASRAKVSNEAPTRGGRADANHAYKAHLAEIGITP